MASSNSEVGVGPSAIVARESALFSYGSMSLELIEMVKFCTLDFLGVVIGASTLAPEAQNLLSVIKAVDGGGPCTVLGFGESASPLMAVFANGSFTHMLDFEDSMLHTHPVQATLPVAFALSQQIGGVTGEDFLAAVGLGIDFTARLSLTAEEVEFNWMITNGWYAPQLLGYLTAAITSAKILRLSEEEIANALGLVYGQLAGSRQMGVGDANQARGFQGGFSSQGGLLSALLAQQGVTGPREILEGRYGLFKNYIRMEEVNWGTLTSGFGETFPSVQHHSFKVWPCGSIARSPITALLELRDENHLTPEQIESITVIGGGPHTEFLTEPIALKRRPVLSIAGKMSIPFVLSVAMVHGNIKLSSFTDAGLHDPTVLAVAEKVFYRKQRDDGVDNAPYPDVEIRLTDGRVLTRRADALPGTVRRPVTRKQLEDKFLDCVSFSALEVSDKQAEQVIDLVDHLETLPDAAEILNGLYPN